MASERRRAIGAFVLALCAGIVDAVGLLSFGHVLLANMSGNSVRLAASIESAAWQTTFHFLWPFAGFMVGLMVTGTLHEARERRGRRWLATVLFTEAALLLAVVALAHARGVPQWSLILLGAAAMGMQNAILRRAAGISVFTTHVTGTLTRFSEETVHLLFWLRDTHRRDRPGSLRAWRERLAGQPFGSPMALLGGLWLFFAVGALLGALLRRHWGVSALLVPCFLLALAALSIAVRPFELREGTPREHERG